MSRNNQKRNTQKTYNTEAAARMCLEESGDDSEIENEDVSYSHRSARQPSQFSSDEEVDYDYFDNSQDRSQSQNQSQVRNTQRAAGRGGHGRGRGRGRGRSTLASEGPSTSTGRGRPKKRTVCNPEPTPEQLERARIVEQKSKLIDLIQEHTFIFDKSHPDHHNSDKVNNKWIDIAKSLNETDGEYMYIIACNI